MRVLVTEGVLAENDVKWRNFYIFLTRTGIVFAILVAR